MPSTNDLHAFATRYFSFLDRRDISGLIANMFSPDCKFAGFGPEDLNNEGVCAAMEGFFAAFPDSNMPVDGVIAEGLSVAIRHRFEGTHRAPFNGIPATGKRVVVSATVTLNIENGKVRRGFLHADMLGLLVQLGAVPPPA